MAALSYRESRDLSPVQDGDTKKTDRLWCVTKPTLFIQPMILCINFCFEFYFPKCLLKEHL